LVTGLFGGTFDPIHNAHLAVARAARDAFALDRVLLVPAAVPPHKIGQRSESWGHRFRMVQLACAGERGLEASDLEAGAEHSYSIYTIERLKAALAPEDTLLFIIGADAFDEIQTWYRWRDVVAAVEFIVVTRPGHSYSVPDGARVHPLGSVHMRVSSSHIRQKLALCERPEELPPAVFGYIRENRLYGYGSARR
jgi:nicotinate-nucleotide adenylyltransferase